MSIKRGMRGCFAHKRWRRREVGWRLDVKVGGRMKKAARGFKP
jgi:hypothetical protein